MPKVFFGCRAIMLAFALVAGCASPRHTVILVADPDGHVGQVEVTTAGGRQILEKPGDMTRVSGPSAPPAPVTTADFQQIAVTFGEALAAEPLPAEKFILFFEFGTTTLTPQSEAALKEVVETIRKREAVRITVSGHTDAFGPSTVNDKLALDRAERVRDLLVQSGTPAGKIEVTSHGKGNPLVPTPDGVAEPRNRRVEVIVR